MINFKPTLPSDLPQIVEWISADPYHQRELALYPSILLTGSDSFLTGCIEDEQGRVLYLRITFEDDLARLGVQFAPYDQVSKRRVVETISKALPILKDLVMKRNKKGFIFESQSPSLIAFMEHFGFTPRPGGKEALDEYLWMFSKELN